MSGIARAAVSLLLAVVLAGAILLDFVPWVLEPRMIPYILPHLLQPSTGFLSLVLVLFLVIWLPLGLPGARLAAALRPDGSAAQGSRPDLPSRPDAGEGRASMRSGSAAEHAAQEVEASEAETPWIRVSSGFPSASPGQDPRAAEDRPREVPAGACEIPLDAVTTMDARRRHEMARALDISWDGRLARDDEAWLRACAGGLQRARRRHR
ncbi:hypothetical protein [Brachybacterium phenoliresistens]|uniref:Uncharacterized protein n=1 Tax=Brachybacterium phenoliresistens TaxID=396014 RepID=Z9JUN7_9MICO|nr:hypothetical protein [Brachybacterium phenoliresistens]EWS82060.1 hypothetical protein BF93_13800 [Brachybacterium phenoliresistens]